ncbi:hypothetical protein SAMN05661044_04363 [Olivibacter domesticus]|uniref:Uncharacterized protein n=1 Tax=Olivibacter domesticus TaxID=407022 RepID=A0A1H7W0C3_OLID1|nr:hypothetical protein SAMN05661044_04363 [Olivibacter domesticus]
MQVHHLSPLAIIISLARGFWLKTDKLTLFSWSNTDFNVNDIDCVDFS